MTNPQGRWDADEMRYKDERDRPDPFEEGEEAFKNGDRRQSPYPAGTKENAEWLRGFDESAEQEEEEPEWDFFSGPFVSLHAAIVTVRRLNESWLWKYGVWPDPATATKWVIKRTPK